MDSGGRQRQAMLKRHALQIAVQLPEKPAEAIEVLELVKELIFWREKHDEKTPLRAVR